MKSVGRWLGIAAIGGVVLAGCASGPHRDPNPFRTLSSHKFQCKGNCDVSAMVLTDEEDGSCVVGVFQDIVEVHGQNRVLTWKLLALDGHQYRFTDSSGGDASDGIEFKMPPSATDWKRIGAVGHDQFKWQSRNPPSLQPKDFPYSVNVKRIDGPPKDCDVLDPKIVNGGD